MISKIKAFFSSKFNSVSAAEICDKPIEAQIIEDTDLVSIPPTDINTEIQIDNKTDNNKERSRLRHLGYI